MPFAGATHLNQTSRLLLHRSEVFGHSASVGGCALEVAVSVENATGTPAVTSVADTQSSCAAAWLARAAAKPKESATMEARPMDGQRPIIFSRGDMFKHL
jgi:hypothetical protein